MTEAFASYLALLKVSKILKKILYVICCSVQSDLSELRITNNGLQMSVPRRVDGSRLFRYAHVGPTHSQATMLLNSLSYSASS